MRTRHESDLSTLRNLQVRQKDVDVDVAVRLPLRVYGTPYGNRPFGWLGSDSGSSKSH